MPHFAAMFDRGVARLAVRPSIWFLRAVELVDHGVISKFRLGAADEILRIGRGCKLVQGSKCAVRLERDGVREPDRPRNRSR